MKITLVTTENFDLSPSQIRLIRYLSNHGPEYLHGRTADLADSTPGIVDEGEGKYLLSDKGWRLLEKIDIQTNKHLI